jgi:hypothetical protein
VTVGVVTAGAASLGVDVAVDVVTAGVVTIGVGLTGGVVAGSVVVPPFGCGFDDGSERSAP